MDLRVHRDLGEAFRQGQEADYKASVGVFGHSAAGCLASAERFVAAVRDLLEQTSQHRSVLSRAIVLWAFAYLNISARTRALGGPLRRSIGGAWGWRCIVWGA